MRRHRPRTFLAPLTFSVLLLGGGLAALLDRLDVIDVDLQVALALALGVIGIALLVSAWFGRARSLVPIAMLLTLVLVAVSVVDTPLEGGIGDRTYAPTTAFELGREYRLAIGKMTLDLRDVPLRTGVTSVDASVAIGELHVYVPSDVNVAVHAEAGAGEVELFGADDGGVTVEMDDELLVAGARTLRLDLRTGVGRLVVDRDLSTIETPPDQGLR